MKVLVLGGGGREHAIVWQLKKSTHVSEIFCAPGNGGTALLAKNVDLNPIDIQSVKNWALENKIDLTIVGPEAPLDAGVVNVFESAGLSIFGVNQQSAKLESSKAFTKDLLKKYKIPTALGNSFNAISDAKDYLLRASYPLVIKADGLASGKGVKICQTQNEAQAVLQSIMSDKEFGDAGNKIVIEDFLVGEEVSYMGFLDGETFLAFPPSQDHKRAFDADKGPNTGGMGAYSPVPWFDKEWDQKVRAEVVNPVIEAIKKEGLAFKGILYIGLLISKGIPYVLEFNVRFGDPEAQVLLYQLESDLIELIQATQAQKLNEFKLKCKHRPTMGVVMASKGYPGSYEAGHEIKGLELLGKEAEVEVFQAGTQLKEGKCVTSSGRVLCVVASDETFEKASKKVYKYMDQVGFKDAFFRKDIGFRLWQKQK